MSQATSKRVKEIVDRTLEVNPSERAAFLDEACGDNDEIRREVEALLSNAVPTRPIDPRPSVPSGNLRPGTMVGSYRIREQIGRGGMGVVYRVLHVGLEREFALKTLRFSSKDHLGIDAFSREAKVLGGLKHRNIVDVTDFGFNGDLPYLVMELVQGSTLRELSTTALSPERVLQLLGPLSDAVDHAHRAGILHGDLKPENVILTRSPEDDCKILDFGIARLIQREENDRRPTPNGLPIPEKLAPTLGMVAGTPSYMAPELFAGARPTVASDVYALAVLTFEILTGERPFYIPPEALTGRWKPPPPPRPSALNRSLPAEIDGPLIAALSTAPEERPSSASKFTTELRRAFERGRARERLRRQRPYRWAAAAALASLVSLFSAPMWSTAPIRRMENRLLDARWALLPKTPPSSEILVITVDDRWVDASAPRSLGQQGDVFAERLQSVFEAGARAVALDLVPPIAWSESEEFSRLVLSRDDQMTLAAFGSVTDGAVHGQECIHPLTEAVLGPERLERLFGIVNLAPDDDGAVRRGRFGFVGRDDRTRLSWAARVAQTIHGDGVPRRDDFLLDQTISIASFPQMSFLDVPEKLAASPETFTGKLVIVGATYEGAGDTFLSHNDLWAGERFPGLFVQANLVQTLISGIQVKEVPKRAVLLVCGAALTLVSALLLLPTTPFVTLGTLIAAFSSFVVIGLGAFYWLHLAIPTAGPLASMCITVASSLFLRGRLR